MTVVVYSRVDVCRHRCACQHIVCVSFSPSCCKVHMKMCICTFLLMCICKYLYVYLLCVYVTVIVCRCNSECHCRWNCVCSCKNHCTAPHVTPHITQHMSMNTTQTHPTPHTHNMHQHTYIHSAGRFALQLQELFPGYVLRITIKLQVYFPGEVFRITLQLQFLVLSPGQHGITHDSYRAEALGPSGRNDQSQQHDRFRMHVLDSNDEQADVKSVLEMLALEQFYWTEAELVESNSMDDSREHSPEICFPNTREGCEDRDVYASNALEDRWMGCHSERQNPK